MRRDGINETGDKSTGLRRGKSKTTDSQESDKLILIENEE